MANVEAIKRTDVIKKSKPRPNKLTGIYFLLEGKEVVYIGQTRSGIGRVWQHMGRINFDSYSFFCVDGAELDEAEAINILQYDPGYNNRLPNGSPYKTTIGISNFLGVNIRSINRMIKEQKVGAKHALGRTFYHIEDFI